MMKKVLRLFVGLTVLPLSMGCSERQVLVAPEEVLPEPEAPADLSIGSLGGDLLSEDFVEDLRISEATIFADLVGLESAAPGTDDHNVPQKRVVSLNVFTGYSQSTLAVLHPPPGEYGWAKLTIGNNPWNVSALRVVGQALRGGVWSDFLFEAEIDLRLLAPFRCNLSIPPGGNTSVVLSLLTDMSKWFRFPDGRMLNPNHMPDNQDAIAESVLGALVTGEVAARGVSSRVVFATGRDGNNEIYIMNGDGSGQTRLTNDVAIERHPSWSPDGSKIGFVSSRARVFDFWIMNPDGTGQTKVTNDGFIEGLPRWSPDGSRVVYSGNREGNREIFVVNVDGSGQTRLTNYFGWDADPAWAPDGSQIVFSTRRAGPGDIYVMNADGTSKTNLTNHPSHDRYPVWSPDGTRIAFLRSESTPGSRELYVMNSDGSGQRRVSTHALTHPGIQWSPGGTKIAFIGDRDGPNDIFVVNADGTNQINLTNDAANDSGPQWSCGGTQIAFSSLRSGNWDIYVMNPDGSGVGRLTTHSRIDAEPQWWPGAGPGCQPVRC